MYCSKCGASAQEGARYCPQCGARLVGVGPQATQSRQQAAPLPANSTAEFLSAAAASGIELPVEPAAQAVDAAPAPQPAAAPEIDIDDEGSPSVGGAIGAILIVVGLAALVGFAVAVAAPRVLGIELVDIGRIVSVLMPEEAGPGKGVEGGDADGEGSGDGEPPAQPTAGQATPQPPASILDEPAAVVVAYETADVDGDGRFTYPVFSASLRGTAVDGIDATLKKDVENAAANAVPADDPDARGTYSGAYTTRSIGVTRIQGRIASVVGQGYQTNGRSRGWHVVDGANYDLVTGAQVSVADLLGMDGEGLADATREAVAKLVKDNPKVEWWDDEVQTWQDNLDEDLETGFVHYFCIEQGACAAISELTLAPASDGMQVVFVAGFKGAEGGYEVGDAVDIADVVNASGTVTITAASVAEALGVEAPRVDSATGSLIVTEG